MKTYTSNQEVLAEFLSIDHKYRTGGYEYMHLAKAEIDFTLIEEVQKTLIQIQEQAVANLAEYKASSQLAIDTSYLASKAEIDLQLEKIADNLLIKKQQLETEYAKMKTAANASALKNGILSSSIIVSLLTSIDQELSDKKILEEDKAQVTSDSLNQKLINILNTKNTKTETLETTYQAKLSAEIKKLQDEEYKKINDALKYNNECKQKEAAHSISFAKATIDEYANNLKRKMELFEFEFEFGATGVNRMINDEKYAVATSYFNTLEPNVAYYYILNEPMYANHFDTIYYTRLKEEYFALI